MEENPGGKDQIHPLGLYRLLSYNADQRIGDAHISNLFGLDVVGRVVRIGLTGDPRIFNPSPPTTSPSIDSSPTVLAS